MSKKKNLLNLFSKDMKYNYHIVSTQNPNGNLIYIIRNGLELNTDSLEFSPTHIVEVLIKECEVNIEKIAPAVFFTEEQDVKKLELKINSKLYHSNDFSNFIDTIKDEYKDILIKDFLLYKNDPEKYNEISSKEKIEYQKDLLDDYIKKIQDKNKNREEKLISYNNDLTKLINEYLEEIIKFEKKDFNLSKEIDKLLDSIIDFDKWIKVNDKPFICKTKIISFEKDRMFVFLTDNNDYSFTSTLVFNKMYITPENTIKIDKNEKTPKIMTDYEFLSQLYNIDINSIEEWEFKNETERFYNIIDYLLIKFKEKNKK